MLAIATPFVLFTGMFILHALLPAWRVPGYIRDEKSGAPVQYRLNGFLVFLIVLVVWATELTGLPREWLWRERYWSMLGALCFAIIVVPVCVFSKPVSDAEGNPLATFWLGRKRTVLLMNVEAKMFLYIVGAGVLAVNALSGAAYHQGLHHADANPGVTLYAAMWLIFAVDYFCFERVQLYTYDLIHEKVGFKSLLGCFVIYPYLYLVPLWFIAEYPAPDFSPIASNALLISATLIFFAGWLISRGANLQKYAFKRWPEKKFLGLIEPRTLGDGDNKILCSGFWGIARHANYCGEFIMAIAMALALGYPSSPWSWVYCVFIFALFIGRQKDDDVHCALKYGEAWTSYKQQTPYRIVPGVY